MGIGSNSGKKLPHGLIYSSDKRPGFSRKRWGRGFVYLDQKGKRISDPDIIKRVKKLVIPPQWADVWIAPDKNAFLQATGRDDKNRKQYIYHEKYIDHRQNYKFKKLKKFGERLPSVRETIAGHLRKRKWTREKVLSLVVAVLDDCGLRIGNEAYKQRNGTIGLTTLRRKHLILSHEDNQLLFEYPGKSGKRRQVALRDPKLIKLVRECSELPGYEVFSYHDESGQRQTIDSEEVNAFVRQLAGEEFSSKDFRTWTASALTVFYYQDAVRIAGEHPARKIDATLVKLVGKEMGNTPAVCRDYYIHPKILKAAAERKIPEFSPEPGEDRFSYSHNLRSWEKIALQLM